VKQQSEKNTIIESLIKKYKDEKGNVIPLLQDIQDAFGYIPEDAVDLISKRLEIPESKLYGVATFYAMYRHRPGGRHLIQLCTNVSCMIMGAEMLVNFLKNRYGLEEGGTTPDGRFSLMIMECIGGCDTAPSMLVNNDFYGNLTKEKIEEILEKYK
jgi:NADH-quinone oxidoreductase E subunit